MMWTQCWASEGELIKQKVQGCDTQSGKFVQSIIFILFSPRIFIYSKKVKVQGCDTWSGKFVQYIGFEECASNALSNE